MFLTPLKYKIYKKMSALLSSKDQGYHANLLLDETLASLKFRMKESFAGNETTSTNLSTNHLNIGNNINAVLKKFGRPAFIKSHKLAGIKHDVVLYKRLLNGQKTKVIYNFVNGETASICFNIKIDNDQQFKNVIHFVKTTYLPNPETELKDMHHLIDMNGNKLYVESTFDIKLTFINNNPEIVQNINAAIYHERYSNAKYLDSSKFQLQL